MQDNDGGDSEADAIRKSAGAILKAEREKQSMTLNDVADKTRITLRHLEAIENSHYSKLPGKTYIVGFAKAYARAVGLNDADIAAQLREELALSDDVPSRHVETYEPAAASSVPPKALAWTVAIIAGIALSAFVIWRVAQLDGTPSSDDAVEISEETNEAEDNSEAKPEPETITAGKVVMSATDEVWLQISDADGKTIYENVMQSGDSYEIPADANAPTILTGRPDVLTFTVGGKAIKPLGDGTRTIKGVGVSAQALIDFNSAAAPAGN